MTDTSTRAEFLRGARGALPFSLVIAPFSMLFGVVATEAGLNVLEVMVFSVAVIAGAAQFTALQLMVDDAPTLIVLISALAVNLRMAMYSATLVPHLGAASLTERAFASYFLVDQAFALGIARYEARPDLSVAQKMAFFWGVVVVIVPQWYGFSFIGAVAGTAIPDWMALDFAVPITFLAVTAPMLRTPAHVIAAGVAITVSLGVAWLPYNLGLIVAGLAGMMAGAEAERRGLAEPRAS